MVAPPFLALGLLALSKTALAKSLPTLARAAAPKLLAYAPYAASKFALYGVARNPVPAYRALLRANARHSHSSSSRASGVSALRAAFRAGGAGVDELKRIDELLMEAVMSQEERGDVPEHLLSDIEMYLMMRGLSSSGVKKTGDRKGDKRGAGAEETRCEHCYITFATSGELRVHRDEHCFPDDPDEVLRRYPIGSVAVDGVSGGAVTIVGPASNGKMRHAKVEARDGKGAVADWSIERLKLV